MVVLLSLPLRAKLFKRPSLHPWQLTPPASGSLDVHFRFAPVVTTVPTVRPLASRAVRLVPVGWTVLVVRPAESRKVVRPPACADVAMVRPEASRYVVWLPAVVADPVMVCSFRE
jgi:hypothetical protein